MASIQIPYDARNIETFELDELFTYCQKKLPIVYVWLAVDRNSKQVIDIEVTNDRGFQGCFKIDAGVEI